MVYVNFILYWAAFYSFVSRSGQVFTLSEAFYRNLQSNTSELQKIYNLLIILIF